MKEDKRLQQLKNSAKNGSGESIILHISDQDFNTPKMQTKVVLGNNEKNNLQTSNVIIVKPSSKEDEKMKNKEEDESLKTHPDGGWGWVVVGAAFLTQCIVVGLQNSSGVIFNELIKKYNQSRGSTG